ncbi:MAG: hypothetical protein LQ346_007819 [Caloplaca aetnensis]|nr:MAG: hypothetical protein LQ346_007819 [Caloplaca aetnensis]
MQDLRIDAHEGSYTAGSIVSGTLSLHGSGNYNVQKFRISFSGRCRIKIVERGSSQHVVHQSDIYLFDEERVLLNGPYTLQAPHAWPFSFKFPDFCDNSGIQGLSRGSSPLFSDEKTQELPPTFDFTSGGAMANDIETSIRYELKGSLETRSRLGKMDVTKPLTLVTCRGTADPDPNPVFQSWPFSVQSLFLLPAYEHREPTFKERMKASIKSRKTPKAQYELSVLIPTVGVIGQVLPLTIGIHYDEDHSTTATTPPVFLVKVTVHLISTAYVRCSSGSAWNSEDVVDDGELEIPIRSFAFQNLQLTDSMDLAPLMDLRLPARGSLFGPTLAPTFKSISLHCKYGLKVQVHVECGRQDWSHDFRVPGFLLLAKDFSPHASIQPANVAVPRLHGHEMKALPSYERATISKI